MAEVLIIYGTSEGHTGVVVDHLRRPLEAAGHLVRACSVDDAPTCPIGYDLVLVGSSIHHGHHNKALTRWVRGNAEFLARVPSAFFQVSLASAGNYAGNAEAERYVADLTRATGWHPDVVGLDTVVHRDYDDTDNEVVGRFSARVVSLLDRAPHAVSA